MLKVLPPLTAAGLLELAHIGAYANTWRLDESRSPAQVPAVRNLNPALTPGGSMRTIIVRHVEVAVAVASVRLPAIRM